MFILRTCLWAAIVTGVRLLCTQHTYLAYYILILHTYTYYILHTWHTALPPEAKGNEVARLVAVSSFFTYKMVFPSIIIVYRR